MSQRARARYRRVVLGSSPGCAAGRAGRSRRTDRRPRPLPMPLFDASRDLLRAERPFRWRDAGPSGLRPRTARGRRPPRARLDLSPALDEIFRFFHRHGLPLQPQHDEDGDGADRRVRRFQRRARRAGGELPPRRPSDRAARGLLLERPRLPLRRRLADQSASPCAWRAARTASSATTASPGCNGSIRRRPLALGIGLPMNLRDAEGDVGFILQLRMSLD